jgi:CRP-like cAMP-binding protein
MKAKNSANGNKVSGACTLSYVCYVVGHRPTGFRGRLATSLLSALGPEFDTALTLRVCNMLRTLFAIHLAKLSLQPEALLLYRLENFCSRLKMGEEDEIEIPISQEEFARMLGVSRRTTVDALAKLQDKNLVRLSYGSIHVKASGFVT